MIRRIAWVMLAALLIGGCASPIAAGIPTAPPPGANPAALAEPPTEVPTPLVDLPLDDLLPTRTPEPPTTAPTDVPAEPPAEPPADVPTAAPADVPTDVPAAPPAEPPAEARPSDALNPQDQAAALLPDYRADLDRAAEWNRYTIVATIDPGARTISGRERLEYTNRDSVALDRLYFHLYPNLRDFGGRLDIAAASVDGQPAPVAYEERRYLLRVDLPQPLAPGASSVVALDFTASAPANASASLYGAFNQEKGVFALASCYPIAAIVRGGRWDTARIPDRNQGDFVNSETALYDVTLTAPERWELVTTGVMLERRAEGGQQTARFVSGPQRDFTIAATQLEKVSAEVDGTRVSSYFRSGQERGGQRALQAATDSLRAFNLRYGRYPLAELDIIQIAASGFAGVEYPGLIMIEENLYGGGDYLEITVAHEVGHQWWYSLVGNDVQTAAWLDEALASYSQVVYREQVSGPAAAEQELEGFRQRYRNAIAAGRDAAVARPTAAFRGNYVSLVYGKAVLFFQALREQIGDQAFDRFLHDYYARHRYGFVAGEDLLASAEGACGCELDRLYADWITSARPVEIP